MTEEGRLALKRKVARANLAPVRNFLPGTAVNRRYLICCSPRTGSTLLCSLLEATGLAGSPLEYLNEVYIEAFCEQLGVKEIGRQEYLSRLEDKRTSPNGLFGIKVHWEQLAQWFKGSKPDKVIAFLRHFDKLIFISRRDKLGQAVSLYRARQSGRWSARHAELAEMAELPVPFSAQGITTALHNILQSETAWQRTFSKVKLAPLKIHYEDIAAKPDAILGEVFNFIGIDERPDSWPAASVQPQRDGQNESLKTAYLQFLGTR